MPYTVTELINKAWYLSGVVSRTFQTVGGQRLSDGLGFLNDLLAMQSIPGAGTIPYYQEYDLVAISGQEKYFIPYLLEIETFTFNIGTVRYSTVEQPRSIYFGTNRVESIQTLPYNWHAEKVKGGTDLYLYFTPDTGYPLRIWGKFALSRLTESDLLDDLYDTFDDFYITYLRYALAQFMCNAESIPFKSRDVLKQLEAQVLNISPPDLTLQKQSTLTRGSQVNYGDANLGKGWRPS